MRLSHRRWMAAAVVGAVAGAAVVATSLASPGPATANTFYDPPVPMPSGANGGVIRHEPTAFHLDPAKALKAPAEAHRIMYRSTDAKGQPMAVTGTVLTPNQPWLGLGPRPVIGFAVGTQGMGDQCAPSKQLAAGTEYEGVFLSGLLQRGYGVVITDYQGLGTPGNHTYVNRSAEGNAVLDAIRAAQRLPEAELPDKGPVLLAGYSQGGGASAAAAELAPTYAPELTIKGAYAGAVPADKAAVGRSLDGKHAAALLGYAIIGLDAAYPELDVRSYLNDKGLQLWDQVSKECVVESIALHALTQSKDLTKDGRAVTAYMDEEPWKSVVAKQKLGNVKPSVPTLVTHSGIDDIVPYEQGKQFAKDWCGKGANVKFTTLTSPTHVAAIAESSTAAFMWMEQRISGLPQLSNCGTF